MGIITQIIVYILATLGCITVLIPLGLLGLSLMISSSLDRDNWLLVIGLTIVIIILMVFLVLILALIGIDI